MTFAFSLNWIGNSSLESGKRLKQNRLSRRWKGDNCNLPNSHLPASAAGIGTTPSGLVGCRGFTGPVPPPLWIRESNLSYELLGYTIAKNKGDVKDEL
jgi:hypothetical protein